MSKAQVSHTVSAPKLWRQMGVASCALTCVAAILYLFIEWNAGGPMKDAPLVALITFNVFAVHVFGLYITRDLTEMLDGFPSFKGADSHTIQAEIDLLMADPRGLVVAIFYGVFLGISAYLISPWPDGSSLQFWFGAFVFCGNLLIGYAIWAILRFWYRILSEVPKIEFKALNLSHAPLPALLRFNSRIVMITAFVASMALLGLALADFDQSPPIILFSIFAFFMVLATYAVPVIPISNRLRRLKTEDLDRIESLIEQHVLSLTDSSVETKDLPDLGKLIEARDLIANVQTLPPGGQVSVSAAAIVTTLSFLPAIIEYLSKMLN